ncbi:MAG: hypothetical protein QXL01_00810 [Thermoplasmatales archaeon]
MHPFHEFYRAVNVSASHIQPPISLNLEYYLFNILISPVITEEPLALLLSKTINSSYNEKISILKTIGDTFLTVVGIFPDSLKNSPVDSKYYMNMGCLSYGQLSKIMRVVYRDNDFAEIYEEIADRPVTSTQILKRAVGLLRATD